MGMLLNACHLTKVRLEFLQGTSICSYTNLLNTKEILAQKEKEDLLSLVALTTPPKDLLYSIRE